MPTDEDPEEDSREDDSTVSSVEGGDGITPGEFEARKTKRAQGVKIVYVEVNGDADPTVITDGGFPAMFGQHYGKMKAMVTRLIILMLLVVLALLLWRVGLLGKLLSLLSAVMDTI